MSGELHASASDLFSRVRRLPPGERGAALDAACAGDRRLREEVESLLGFDRSGTGFLGTPALGAGIGEAVASAARGVPERIGGFRVLGVLGEGGMGVVYRAEQERPRRVVALKMMRHGFATEAARRRFEREGELLARLHHPGIAQVFETGADGAGRPYIAMELVEGAPLGGRAAGAGLDARLGLLLQVCDAVQHAHQRGVIHRDIKSANVLVERVEGSAGRAKVLDFGVGRALGEEAGATERTEAGALVGTLRSMSPEQLSGDPDAVDARSDVYALGVLGYEVLGGTHPFASVVGGLAEVSEAITRREPARLGTIERALRGDLETIVARAMEKDPARRYQSAGELAADLRRYLCGEPILARPASTTYQLRKLAVRHKAAAGALLAASVIGAIAVAGITWQAIRATRAEHLANDRAGIADEQTRIANAVNEFLQSILAAGDPRNTDNPDITVKQALDNAASDVGERFRDQPAVEVAIRRVIGDTYRSLGFPLDAAPHLEMAVALAREHLPESDENRMRAVGDLAILYKYLNRVEESAPLFEEDLRLRRLIEGPDAESTLVAEVNFARLQVSRGELALAEGMLRDTLGRMRAELGATDINTLVTMQHLGHLLMQRGRMSESLGYFEGALAGWRERGEGEHPYAVVAISMMARVHRDEGRDARALEACEEGLAIAGRALGADHPLTLVLGGERAIPLARRGRAGEALAMLDDTIARLGKRIGPETLDVLQLRLDRVLVLLLMGRVEDAASASAGCLRDARAQCAEGHWRVALALALRGEVLQRLGNGAEAEPLLEESAALYSAAFGAAHPRTREVLGLLGRSGSALRPGG